MKAVDSSLLVYASLSNHPAVSVCERHLAAYPAWACNIANLVEMRHVLVSVYGLAEDEADAKFADFRAALTVDPLTPTVADAAVSLRRSHGVDLNDAILIETCRRQGITHLATDDRRLAAACKTLGIAPESPVDDAVRLRMSEWEEQHLPAKSLPRVLLQVHRWLKHRDAALAGEFQSATQSLPRLV